MSAGDWVVKRSLLLFYLSTFTEEGIKAGRGVGVGISGKFVDRNKVDRITSRVMKTMKRLNEIEDLAVVRMKNARG
jgi:hypothetical protein